MEEEALLFKLMYFFLSNAVIKAQKALEQGNVEKAQVFLQEGMGYAQDTFVSYGGKAETLLDEQGRPRVSFDYDPRSEEMSNIRFLRRSAKYGD